ncbi:MAG: sulfotransferase family 2 domain-containing protein [Elainella sp.]
MKNKIFFFHIAKTAGSSFSQFLAKHYWGEAHCERYLAGAELVYLDYLAQLDYISGHIRLSTFVESGLVRENYFLLTFLREPIAQLLSNLNWVMHIYDISPSFFGNHPQFVQAMSLELRSLNLYEPDALIYALEKFQNWFKNNQSRYFSVSQDVCAEKVIETMSQLDMIGLTEHYEQSLRQFADARNLRMTSSALKRVNQNLNYRVSKDILDNPLIHEFLLDYNQVDIAVYSYFYPKIVQSFPPYSMADPNHLPRLLQQPDKIFSS